MNLWIQNGCEVIFTFTSFPFCSCVSVNKAPWVLFCFLLFYRREFPDACLFYLVIIHSHLALSHHLYLCFSSMLLVFLFFFPISSLPLPSLHLWLFLFQGSHLPFLPLPSSPFPCLLFPAPYIPLTSFSLVTHPCHFSQSFSFPTTP